MRMSEFEQRGRTFSALVHARCSEMVGSGGKQE